MLLQDFLEDKKITLREGEALCLPPVWDWSQQLSIRDQALFNNPIYVGKPAPYAHNGAVKSFRRTKVSGSAASGKDGKMAAATSCHVSLEIQPIGSFSTGKGNMFLSYWVIITGNQVPPSDEMFNSLTFQN